MAQLSQPTKTDSLSAGTTMIDANTPNRIDGLTGDDVIFGSGTGLGVGGAAPPIDSDGGGATYDNQLQGSDKDDSLYVGSSNDDIKGGDGKDKLSA